MNPNKKLSDFLNVKLQPKKKRLQQIEEPKKDEIATVNDENEMLNDDEIYIPKQHLVSNNIIDDNDILVTSITYSKRTAISRWSDQETNLFYKALELCGTEFSLICSLFKNKNRKQIKKKYLNEIKKNKEKVENVLKESKGFNRDQWNDLIKKFILDK